MTTAGGATDPACAGAVKKALANIHALLKGNAPDSLTPQLISEKVTQQPFTAQTQIVLSANVSRRLMAGRDGGGDVLQNEAQIDGAVNIWLASLLSGPERERITDPVLKRPDQGLGARDGDVPIPAFVRTFSIWQDCGQCRASGHSPCLTCNGAGRMACPTCHGSRVDYCSYCRGSGRTMGAQGEEMCRTCSGSGRTACRMCQSAGEVRCPKCPGDGRVRCASCAGSGQMTLAIHARALARSVATRFAADMPPALSALLQKRAGGLAARGTIAMQPPVLTPPAPDGAASPAARIDYAGHIPYGDVEISLDGDVMKGQVYGKHGGLAGFPPFLEKTTSRALAELDRACNHPRLAAGALRRALNTRLVRDALRIHLYTAPAKRIGALARLYPAGVKNETLVRILQQSAQALRLSTRASRWIGCAAGSAAAAIAYAGYFLSGRAAVAPFLPDANLIYGVDAGVWVAGSLIVAAAIETAAHHMTRRLIPGAAPKAGSPIGTMTALTLAGTTAVFVGLWVLYSGF